MKEHSDIVAMNKWLSDNGGERTDDKLPNYRLVWSEEIFEARLSTFRDFDSSGAIFLREVTEVRTVPKYNYIKNRWILEKYFGYSADEIKNGDGYECIYCFEDKNGNFLVPTIKVLDIILYSARYGKPQKWRERVAEMKDKEFKSIQSDIDHVLDVTPEDIAYRLGERVSMAGTKERVN